MTPCPACARSSLVDFEVQQQVQVELCPSCKGMLVNDWALEQLAGPCDIEALSESHGKLSYPGPCPRCSISDWRSRRLLGASRAGVGLCGTCGMVWLEAGELSYLRRRLAQERHRVQDAFASTAREEHEPETTVPAPLTERSSRTSQLASESTEALDAETSFGRIPFDRGVGNLIGVPLALVLSLLFCSRPTGRFLGGLTAMPFHELGHALTSWLSSRFAVPLPFFTIWQNDQSWLFGISVAAALAWFGFHSWRERSRLGMGVAGALLSIQVIVSWFLPARLTLMLQILGGALGEILLGALLLVAFHFPLPDRLRWDFWRWPLLLPGALCFAHSLLLWQRAASDVGQLPWGSAIGSESDGDMNRLVRDFGWRADELAAFYLKAVWLASLALAGFYALAVRRYQQARYRQAG